VLEARLADGGISRVIELALQGMPFNPSFCGPESNESVVGAVEGTACKTGGWGNWEAQARSGGSGRTVS
jgi:hypothetical protein